VPELTPTPASTNGWKPPDPMSTPIPTCATSKKLMLMPKLPNNKPVESTKVTGLSPAYPYRFDSCPEGTVSLTVFPAVSSVRFSGRESVAEGDRERV
jgi:hypothetical protein